MSKGLVATIISVVPLLAIAALFGLLQYENVRTELVPLQVGTHLDCGYLDDGNDR